MTKDEVAIHFLSLKIHAFFMSWRILTNLDKTQPWTWSFAFEALIFLPDSDHTFYRQNILLKIFSCSFELPGNGRIFISLDTFIVFISLDIFSMD